MMISLETLKEKVIDALEDIKGRDIITYQVGHITSLFEYVIIATGDSSRQTKALARHLHDKMREIDINVIGIEGESEGEWVLVDLGSIVIHIMHPTAREYYNLEGLWEANLNTENHSVAA